MAKTIEFSNGWDHIDDEFHDIRQDLEFRQSVTDLYEVLFGEPLKLDGEGDLF